MALGKNILVATNSWIGARWFNNGRSQIFQDNMRTVILHHNNRNHKFQLPTETSELTGLQAARLYHLMHTVERGPEFLAQLALVLFNLKPFDVVGRAWLGSLPGNQFKQLEPALAPFLEDIRQEVQVMSGFWYKGWYYVGPKSKLSNISLIEFAFADHHFLSYHNNPNDEDLYALLACLYRPFRFGNSNMLGDSRQAFNEHSYENRAHWFKCVPKAYAYYALELFRGGRELIVERWEDLFNEDETGSVASSTNGWVSLIYSMAGDKFGTLQQAKQAKLTDVLLYCRINKEDNERIKKDRNNG